MARFRPDNALKVDFSQQYFQYFRPYLTGFEQYSGISTKQYLTDFNQYYGPSLLGAGAGAGRPNINFKNYLPQEAELGRASQLVAASALVRRLLGIAVGLGRARGLDSCSEVASSRTLGWHSSRRGLCPDPTGAGGEL